MRNRQVPIPGRASRRFGWRWIPALFYLALIHLASSGNPGDLGVSLPAGLDKIAHLFEFGLLTVLLWRPLRDAIPDCPEVKTAVFLFIFVALNGIIDEYHQSFIPGRESSWADGAADFLGGALATVWLLHREKGRPAPAPSAGM